MCLSLPIKGVLTLINSTLGAARYYPGNWSIENPEHRGYFFFVARVYGN
jgi:hypothetical protein